MAPLPLRFPQLKERSLEPKKLTPEVPLHDPRFVYVPSAATDVRQTWARFGWTAPSEKGKK